MQCIYVASTFCAARERAAVAGLAVFDLARLVFLTFVVTIALAANSGAPGLSRPAVTRGKDRKVALRSREGVGARAALALTFLYRIFPAR
jgi:hypothetical protein